MSNLTLKPELLVSPQTTTSQEAALDTHQKWLTHPFTLAPKILRRWQLQSTDKYKNLEDLYIRRIRNQILSAEEACFVTAAVIGPSSSNKGALSLLMKMLLEDSVIRQYTVRTGREVRPIALTYAPFLEMGKRIGLVERTNPLVDQETGKPVFHKLSTPAEYSATSTLEWLFLNTFLSRGVPAGQIIVFLMEGSSPAVYPVSVTNRYPISNLSELEVEGVADRGNSPIWRAALHPSLRDRFTFLATLRAQKVKQFGEDYRRNFSGQEISLKGVFGSTMTFLYFDHHTRSLSNLAGADTNTKLKFAQVLQKYTAPAPSIAASDAQLSAMLEHLRRNNLINRANLRAYYNFLSDRLGVPIFVVKAYFMQEAEGQKEFLINYFTTDNLGHQLLTP